jgi:hypothetical protein
LFVGLASTKVRSGALTVDQSNRGEEEETD